MSFTILAAAQPAESSMLQAAAPTVPTKPATTSSPANTSVSPKGVSPGEQSLAEPGPAEPARLGWAGLGWVWAAAWIVSVSGRGLPHGSWGSPWARLPHGSWSLVLSPPDRVLATLTDSPLPTSVVSKGEPALPLSCKFSSFLVVALHSPVQ